MEDQDRTRRAAKVHNVTYGPGDHGNFNVMVYLEFDSGGIQGFGGLSLNKEESGPRFARAISNIFDVTYLNDIIGKKCWVLFPFGYYNETIEGIETEYGRVTLTGFLRKYDPNFKSPLDFELARQRGNIEHAVRQLSQAVEKLKVLDKIYKDWG
jgi:hypothetical protein